MPMLRNGFVAFYLGLVSVCSAEKVCAQEVVRIAYVSTNTEVIVRARANDILREIESRWPKGRVNRPEIVFDIYRFVVSDSSMQPAASILAQNRAMYERVTRTNPKIIYAAGADAAMLAKEVTTTIPIVMGCKCNPGPTSIRRLVLNLCAPEANLTGFTRYDVRVIAPDSIAACDTKTSTHTVLLENLTSLRFEILRDAREPKLQRIGMFYGQDYDENKWRYVDKGAALGVIVIPIRLNSETIASIPKLFQTHALDAAIVASDNLLDRYTEKLIQVTSTIPKPTLFPWDEADHGAWLHFGTKVDLAARAADYLLPLLQGVKVKDLPVSYPSEYELVVNHELAKKHGWMYPRRFLLQPQREARLQ
jgi:putative tryptophan/tyrosine transport system substrate-binding protein